MRKYGIEIGGGATIGLGLRLPHPKNITIGRYVAIGNNCKILHGVTLGIKNSRWSAELDNGYAFPSIGDNVVLCVNCSVLGGVHVGHSTTVGAGAVLLADALPNSVYAGIPATRVSNDKTLASTS